MYRDYRGWLADQTCLYDPNISYSQIFDLGLEDNFTKEELAKKKVKEEEDHKWMTEYLKTVKEETVLH